MILVIGLGNPGREYENTRHNIGFLTLDKLAASADILIEKKKHQALLGQGFISGKKVLLAKPQTYMNLSGRAVLEITNYYANQIEDLLVIHDDLDLPFGQLRFKQGGGTGGHNGLKSIEACLNSREFDRLKLGIGRPKHEKIEVKDHVLQQFSSAEKEELEEVIKRAEEGVKKWLDSGIAEAMNIYNRRPEK